MCSSVLPRLLDCAVTEATKKTRDAYNNYQVSLKDQVRSILFRDASYISSFQRGHRVSDRQLDDCSLDGLIQNAQQSCCLDCSLDWLNEAESRWNLTSIARIIGCCTVCLQEKDVLAGLRKSGVQPVDLLVASLQVGPCWYRRHLCQISYLMFVFLKGISVISVARCQL